MSFAEFCKPVDLLRNGISFNGLFLGGDPDVNSDFFHITPPEKGIKNIVDAIEQGISTKSTRERLLDLEQRKNDIEMSISKESIENPMLTKKQFKFWFDQLKKLDISKSEQRQKLVDLFVNSIIIYDDHIKFFFNYKEHTETITFDELNNCSDLPDSPRP